MTNETIEDLKSNIKDLDENVSRAIEAQEKQGMPILDYQKEYKVKKGEAPIPPTEILRASVNRIMMLNKFHRRNDVKLSGLMNQIIMRKLEEDRKAEKQRNQLLNSI